MKIGLLTFEQYLGKRDMGSSLIRGHWLVKYWPEAELFQMGQAYDVVIYQKAYWVEHARKFKGIKILDICDPDFLHWGYRVKEMLEEVDGVTTSSEALAEVFRRFTDKPVICIPDRVDLKSFIPKKHHQGRAEWVGWFGYSHNFEMLNTVVHHLAKLGLNLTVISDGGFNAGSQYTNDIQVRNLPFNRTTFNDDLLDCDIVINPQSSRGKWKFKSNNKTLQAWALGIPVAMNIIDLKKFMDESARREEALKRVKEVEEKWDVVLSVKQYQDFIEQLKASKKE